MLLIKFMSSLQNRHTSHKEKFTCTFLPRHQVKLNFCYATTYIAMRCSCWYIFISACCRLPSSNSVVFFFIASVALHFSQLPHILPNKIFPAFYLWNWIYVAFGTYPEKETNIEWKCWMNVTHIIARKLLYSQTSHQSVCSEYTPILQDLLGLPKTPFNVLMLLGIPWNKAKNKSIYSIKYMSFFVKNGN